VPRLYQLRKRLIAWLEKQKIDLLIGIDAPDFNLGLETYFKKKSVPTVHYVSPSVWAWRPWRVEKIKKACDQLLVLFPFEVEFYKEHGLDAYFVGHPLVDQIPENLDKLLLRKQLGLLPDAKIIAVLPGSRASEWTMLGLTFVFALKRLAKKIQEPLHFAIPVVSDIQRQYLLQIFIRHWPEALNHNQVHFYASNSHHVMAAADAVLLASGTAALECALLQKPMVVGYRLKQLNRVLAKLLVKIPYVSLPNILLNQSFVPELLNQNCQPKQLALALSQVLNSDYMADRYSYFQQIRTLLKADSTALVKALPL
jgi:lipid-A-disaccharide synthase